MDIITDRPPHLAGPDNPLPRKSNGDGYTMHRSEIAAALCIPDTKERVQHELDTRGIAYRPWFGGQIDARPEDIARLVERPKAQRRARR